MKNIFVFTLLFSLFSTYSNAQFCSVTVSPLNYEICIGDSVNIVSVSNIVSSGQQFDFNNSTLPPGWATTGGTNFSTPCGPNPSGTSYYWASTAGSSTPMISTANFDVTCGGFILFDMVYSIQSGSAPCEGPDQNNEGVSFQYSLNGGTTWINIIYYSPTGVTYPSNPGTTTPGVGAGQTTPFTSWATYTIPIPSGALTSSTMFRWIQTNSSSASNDNWGLDNIIINASGTPCGSTTVVNWTNGLMDTDSFWAYPTGDTTFQAMVYDTLGNLQCTSQIVTISVFADEMTYNLIDTAYSYCPTFSPTVGVTNIGNSIPPYSYNWSTPSITNPTVLPSSGLEHDTIVYYVTITDGCNYTREDSVVLIINQTLQIDTMYSFPATCDPTGAVSVVIEGQITSPTHGVYYTWNGPGATNPSFINASVWTDLSSGWYYIYVEDAVCSVSDSLFVDITNPPIASFTGNPTSGCAPVNVVFTNNSQNTTSYEWDFGNGTVLNVNDLGSQSQTFNDPSTVRLIAYASPTCADTAYLEINISYCGCTDAQAINYNPLAMVDDGSCIFPTPIIIVPNIFTPNNDNNNDLFFLDVTNYKEIKLTITNRWGNVMYSGTGTNPAWDGKTKSGSFATDGTYFYKYTVTPIEGSDIEGHGFLQLMRE